MTYYFNYLQGSQAHSMNWQEEVSGTLMAGNGGNAVCYGFPLYFRAENTRTYPEVATTIVNGTNPGHYNGVIIVDDTDIQQG